MKYHLFMSILLHEMLCLHVNCLKAGTMRVKQFLLLPLIAVSAQPTVTIPSGAVQGISTNIGDGVATVNKFLGIPYATTSSRFSRPEPPKPWTEPLDATEFGPACYQNFGLNGSPTFLEAGIVYTNPQSRTRSSSRTFADSVQHPKSTRERGLSAHQRLCAGLYVKRHPGSVGLHPWRGLPDGPRKD